MYNGAKVWLFSHSIAWKFSTILPLSFFSGKSTSSATLSMCPGAFFLLTSIQSPHYIINVNQNPSPHTFLLGRVFQLKPPNQPKPREFTHLPASNVNQVESRPYRRRALKGQETSLTLGFWMSQRQIFSNVICKVHSPCTSKLGDGIKYTLNLSGRKTKDLD